jgi:hypothetical protein
MNEWEIKFKPYGIFKQLYRSFGEVEKIFHVHGSFGDVYVQIAVLSELAKSKKVTFGVIVDQKYDLLVNTLRTQGVTIAFGDGAWVNDQFASIGLLGNSDPQIIRLLCTVYPMIPELIHLGHLSYIKFLRCLAGSSEVGRLPKIEAYDEDQLLQTFAQSNVVPGKTVILSMDNNTHEEFPEEFWLTIIGFIKDLGLIPCINASGTLQANTHRILSNSQLPTMKINPEQAVSLVEMAGFYIGGTNGFDGIQAFFNEKSKGLHLINFINNNTDFANDKFGNIHPLETFYIKKACSEIFIGLQHEIVVRDSNAYAEILDCISTWGN